MRRLFPVIALLLAACATTPPAPVTPTAPTNPSRPERGDLIGQTANDLVVRLGTPRIQVREGDGTKLQFASSSCVLDAYLYPGGGGIPRVTHVDTRARDGRDVDQQSCVNSLLAR